MTRTPLASMSTINQENAIYLHTVGKYTAAQILSMILETGDGQTISHSHFYPKVVNNVQKRSLLELLYYYCD